MRYRVCSLSSFALPALAAEYEGLPAARRLHAPERATPVRMAAELVLRALLSEHTGVPPEAFCFLRTPRGKPYAENAPFFNFSHSGDWILCAVSDTPVGADIETPRTVSPILLRRVCTPAELAYIGDDAKRFLEIWTAKEAYLKYRGTGICGDLRKIETIYAEQSPLQNYHCLREQTEEYVFTIVCEGNAAS